MLFPNGGVRNAERESVYGTATAKVTVNDFSVNIR